MLILLLALSGAAIWYFNSVQDEEEVKFAFAADHEFGSPTLFFTGRMTYEVLPADRRMIKLKVHARDLELPKTLIVEDGELDFIGTVYKDEMFVPLEIYQIHNDRTGELRTAPVTNCRTYLDVPLDVDTILVVVDEKYVLKGARTGYHRYVIPFCETTREHTFRILDPDAHGFEPAVYAYSGRVGKGATLSTQPYGGAAGQRMGIAPAGYFGGGSPAPTPQPRKGTSPSKDKEKKTEASVAGGSARSTKVVVTLPRRLDNPWVYVNDKRQKDYNLEGNGTQIVFWTKQNGQPINVRVGDANCECLASGRADRPLLEITAACECRDVLVYVNLDRGLDRYRSRIQVYIDGQLTNMPIPPAGQPLVFVIRKISRPQNVELKLALPDDTGRLGLFDLCEFTVPSETTTVVLNPPCYCPTCPPNVKISG
ncbi:MAG: hypothetical protein RMJ33_02540 [Saprospiraceae bacterium]|nr:hypothetical protein [Saprospiraceae bacterium]MDW8228694.1 hypothetical protein [Saprospiraceae bacterium]